MSPLEFIKPTEDVNFNVLLYGPPKTGKSLGAASAPGPVLYLNADLPNATRTVHALFGNKIHEARVTGLDTLIDATILAKSGEYRTVVLDPVGDVHRAVIEGLSGRAIRPKRDDYGDTTVHVERFCRSMCDIPVNFVIVAHETAVKDEETGAFERQPWTGTSNPALGSKLMGMVDIVGYTAVLPPEQDGGAYRYMAQLVNGNGRRGGDRFMALGPYRSVDLTEWESIIRQSTEPASEPAQKEKVAA